VSLPLRPPPVAIAVLLLVPNSSPIGRANQAEFDSLAAADDDIKSPILGAFYLLSLRTDLAVLLTKEKRSYLLAGMAD